MEKTTVFVEPSSFPSKRHSIKAAYSFHVIDPRLKNTFPLIPLPLPLFLILLSRENSSASNPLRSTSSSTSPSTSPTPTSSPSPTLPPPSPSPTAAPTSAPPASPSDPSPPCHASSSTSLPGWMGSRWPTTWPDYSCRRRQEGDEAGRRGGDRRGGEGDALPGEEVQCTVDSHVVVDPVFLDVVEQQNKTELACFCADLHLNLVLFLLLLLLFNPIGVRMFLSCFGKAILFLEKFEQLD